MTKDEENRIIRSAWDTWGDEEQLPQIQEECAELIVAISHHRRGRVGIEAVIEEAADVLIAARQIELAFPDAVREVVARKLIRLEGRVEEARKRGKR